METNFELEYCSTDEFNEIMSSKITDVKTSHEHNSVENVAEDDEPWKIEEESDCDVDIDLDVSPICKVLMLDPIKKVLVPYKKLKNSSCVVAKPLSNEDKLKELKTEVESNLPPTPKKIKPLRFTELLEMQKTPDLEKDLDTNHKIPKKKFEHNENIEMNLNQNINNGKNSSNSSLDFIHLLDNEPSKNYCGPSSKDLNNPSCSKDLYGPSCSKDLYGPSCSKDLYGPSCSKDLYGPSCSKDLYGPSCSKDFYSSSSKDLPDLTNSNNSSVKFNSLHTVSKPSVSADDDYLKMSQQEEVELLLDFYNKVHSNEFTVQNTKHVHEDETNQDAKALAIDECDIIKDLLNNVNQSNEDSITSSENSECFEEDPDIVNPDIMYNIDLNEHLKQMNLLIEKISKTPNDPSLLDECMQLTQIPQIESTKKIFTAKERQNFAEGISEWEYDIDKEDWNKIMVKRAVVFTAHAGFSIANEESLYVLADVAISYIKKLAVIMKKNFDIQLKSSCSDSIDPINNSLQEIGVTGISELIKHYENDVFGKRDKLMKKCQHFQKIIDQFVDRLFLDPKIRNKYSKDDLEEENLYVKVTKKDEAVFQKEKTIGIEIQSMAEEIKIDSLSTAEKTAFTNVEVEQATEPIYIDNTDNEGKIDIDSNNFEKIKTDFLDSIILTNDRKISSNEKQINSKIKNSSDIDLLEPLEISVARLQGKSSNIKEECSSSIDL